MTFKFLCSHSEWSICILIFMRKNSVISIFHFIQLPNSPHYCYYLFIHFHYPPFAYQFHYPPSKTFFSFFSFWFWNPFQNPTNKVSSLNTCFVDFENPSSFRVCAISLFSSLKVQGISKTICLSYLMRALELICSHSLMPIFLLFPLEIRGMSKNISSFYLLKAT